MNRIGIIGGGTAGMTAAIYAVRGGCQATVFEQAMFGGQIVNTASIENYPGLYQVSGADYAMKLYEQCVALGVEFLFSGVTAARLEDREKILESGGKEHAFDAVIIANGAQYRKLGCPGEERLTGHGVSYCATCDGAFFRDLEVFVAGGGDSAVEEAIFLTRFARHVTIVHRRDRLRASRGLQERAFANEKISFLWDSVVAKAEGDGALQAVTVRHVKTGEETVFRASPADGLMGLFGFTGHLPSTGLFTESLPLENGYIPTGEDMSTAVPGVFAAGDIRVKSVRQVVTAAADGAVAAVSAERFLTERQV